MFGYVIIDKPNILIKDYATYKAYYCGMCKSLAKRSGEIMRLTLNYDIVLLSLLAHNYEKKDPEFKKGHCPIHWIKKIEYVAPDYIGERVADANTILGYYKVYDDVVDEGKKKLILQALKPYYKKAKKRLPDFDKAVKEGYEKIRRAEKDEAPIEKLSDLFGETLMYAGEAITDNCDSLLKEFLYNLGRWVYVIDAYDDVKKDSEKGNFNPFLREKQTVDDKFYDSIEPIAREALYNYVDNIIQTYNKMNIVVSEGALSNIVYLGLKSRIEGILKKRGKKCQEIRI